MSEVFEVIIKGDEEVIHGFVEGCVKGAEIDDPYFIAKDVGVQHDSAMREMAEAIHLVENHSHVIAGATVRDVLVEAARDDHVDVDVVDTRRVTGAHVEFSWKVFSRDKAEHVRQLVDSRQASVEVKDYEPTEEIHDEVKGESGMYAPMHAYTAHASGRAHGDALDLIAWVVRLREDPFIHIEEIHLDRVG